MKRLGPWGVIARMLPTQAEAPCSSQSPLVRMARRSSTASATASPQPAPVAATPCRAERHLPHLVDREAGPLSPMRGVPARTVVEELLRDAIRGPLGAKPRLLLGPPQFREELTV
jgi:hypothetical protein